MKKSVIYIQKQQIIKLKIDQIMKTTLKFLIGFMCSTFIMNAQSIERQVIGSAGTTLSNGTISIDFTVGELAVTTITDGTTTLTQGFHQPTIVLSILVDPVVFLQGAALNPNTGEESLMRDDLRSGSIPNRSPYADMLTCENTVFNDGGISTTGATNDNIVDWVYVELRSAADNTAVIDSKSALLQRDGNIVDVDGISNIEFTMPQGNYYVAVHHRNHLSIISNSAIALSNTVTTVDFTNAASQITFGSNAQTVFGMPNNIVAMWAGNVNADTVVQYSGTNPDSPSILSEVLNAPGNFLNFPTYVVTGYNSNDVNMDGNTQYAGTTPDTPFILQNILAHPGNFLNFSTYQIQEQLPEN
jgi:hypothetical protein